MKHLILASLLLLSICSYAQEPLTFSDVVKTDSTDTKDDLFVAAKMWFVSFANRKDVLPVSDKETSEVTGQCSMPYYSNIFIGSNATRGTISYEVHVYCKDGRYKYEVTNFRHSGTSVSGQYGVHPALTFGLLTTDSLCPADVIPDEGVKWRNNIWAELRTMAREEATLVAESLKKGMIKASRKKKEDW